jgi:hypothetical protein
VTHDDKKQSLALVPRSMVEAETMATTLAKSSMLPEHFRGKVSDVFWAISYGLEVGLPPVASLNSVYVVHGRPGLYADAMVALVLSSGLAKYFTCISSDAKHATYETHRVGDPEPRRVSITIEQAQAAGWTKSNAKYQTEPQRMLEARSKSWLAKDKYPDVMRGIAAVEELRDEEGSLPHSEFRAPAGTTPPPSRVIDVASEPAPPAEDPAKELARALAEVTTAAELEKLLPALGRQKEGPVKLELRQLYAAKKDQLRRLAEKPATDATVAAQVAALTASDPEARRRVEAGWVEDTKRGWTRNPATDLQRAQAAPPAAEGDPPPPDDVDLQTGEVRE